MEGLKPMQLSHQVFLLAPLEGQGSRPPSRVSEIEGDLGLASLLGGGEVLNVGESHTQESAMSETGDVTVVAAQTPRQRARVSFFRWAD